MFPIILEIWTDIKRSEHYWGEILTSQYAGYGSSELWGTLGSNEPVAPPSCHKVKNIDLSPQIFKNLTDLIRSEK